MPLSPPGLAGTQGVLSWVVLTDDHVVSVPDNFHVVIGTNIYTVVARGYVVENSLFRQDLESIN